MTSSVVLMNKTKDDWQTYTLVLAHHRIKGGYRGRTDSSNLSAWSIFLGKPSMRNRPFP